MYTSYAQVKITAGNKGPARTSRPVSDEEPHVASLKCHLRGRLELTGSRAEPADVEILLDAGAGVTGISEDVYLRLQQLWTGEKFDKLSTSGVKAQIPDAQVM